MRVAVEFDAGAPPLYPGAPFPRLVRRVGFAVGDLELVDSSSMLSALDLALEAVPPGYVLSPEYLATWRSELLREVQLWGVLELPPDDDFAQVPGEWRF